MSSRQGVRLRLHVSCARNEPPRPNQFVPLGSVAGKAALPAASSPAQAPARAAGSLATTAIPPCKGATLEGGLEELEGGLAELEDCLAELAVHDITCTTEPEDYVESSAPSQLATLARPLRKGGSGSDAEEAPARPPTPKKAKARGVRKASAAAMAAQVGNWMKRLSWRP